jgi:hypothetical protein
MSAGAEGEVELIAFSAYFPLPIRILSLVTLGLFAFASNLHFFDALSLDAAYILDVRLSSHGFGGAHIHTSRLYPPLYQLGLVYAAFTFAGCLVIRFWPLHRDQIAALWLAIGLVAAGWPFRNQRSQFLRTLKRALFDGLWKPVAFCDVIFGDILTSFAKILGDLWTVFVAPYGLGAAWGVPLMTV